MAIQYYWDKYNVNTVSTGYGNVQDYAGDWGSTFWSGSASPMTAEILPTSYNFSSSNGFYSQLPYVSYAASVGDIVLSVFSTSVSYKKILSYGYGINPSWPTSYAASYQLKKFITCSEETETVRGTFIENILADEGTYPINGIQSGYWYVRRERKSSGVIFGVT